MTERKIATAFASIASALPEGLAWSYKETVRAGSLYHQWELNGDRGGIHVSAWWRPSSYRDQSWLGGIEAHSPIPLYGEGTPPDHAHCWLIDKPCWHDGSSLQFSEQIAPMLPFEDRPFGEYEHMAVIHTMLNRYDSWLPKADEIAAGRREEA